MSKRLDYIAIKIDSKSYDRHKLPLHTLRTKCVHIYWGRGLRGRGRMVVGFVTAYAISAYHH